jgi:hypothetical protein
MKPKKSQLTNTLTTAINNFHGSDAKTSLETIETCLSTLLKHRYLFPTAWANYLTDIYDNPDLTTDEKDTLFHVFATFTTDDDVLLSHLTYVIRNAKDDNNYLSRQPYDDDAHGHGDYDDDDDGDSGKVEVHAEAQTTDAKNDSRDQKSNVSEPGKTWQEQVGTKILNSAPHLVSPEPLSVVSKTYDYAKSVLKLAVSSSADWVIPPNLSNLNPKHQTRVRDFLNRPAPKETLLELAVGLGNVAMIQKLIALLKAVELDQTERGSLLQNAIMAKKADIARLLVEQYPEMIEKTPNNLSALQVLRRTGSFAKHVELEDFLVSKTIRRSPPSLVRKLLAEQTGQCGILFLKSIHCAKSF